MMYIFILFGKLLMFFFLNMMFRVFIESRILNIIVVVIFLM